MISWIYFPTQSTCLPKSKQCQEHFDASQGLMLTAGQSLKSNGPPMMINSWLSEGCGMMLTSLSPASCYFPQRRNGLN